MRVHECSVHPHRLFYAEVSSYFREVSGFKVVLQKKKKKPEARLLWMFSVVLVFLVKNYGSENISNNVV